MDAESFGGSTADALQISIKTIRTSKLRAELPFF